jgi:hypothetical protein
MGLCGALHDRICADAPPIEATHAAHASQHAKKFDAILMCGAL